MTKVKRISVSNLKAVSDLTADFNGCTAILIGGNNKGKTSFLRSLPERLRGVKGVVLKHGETNGKAEWELTSGEKFLWEFSEGKEKLTYISDKNIPQAVTKAISSHYFPDIFDVDRFLNDTPKNQNKTLQGLSGIDFTEIDKLYKDAYDQRTYRNKQVSEAKAKLVFYDPKAPLEENPYAELETELNGIEAHNLRYEGVEGRLLDKKNRQSSIGFEIASLQDRIAALQQEGGELQLDIDKGNAWVNDESNKPKTNALELQSQIAAAKSYNNQVAENLKAKQLQDDYDESMKLAAQADEEVKSIEATKADTIKMADLPEGFGFSEDGITYDGFPYKREVLSSSKIYIGALKLASKQLGEVKTIYFDASYLDKNSLQEIEKWAESEGLQLLMERPDYEGGDIQYELVQNITE